MKDWLTKTEKLLQISAPADYENFMRMDAESFEELLQLVTPHIEKKNHYQSKAFSYFTNVGYRSNIQWIKFCNSQNNIVVLTEFMCRGNCSLLLKGHSPLRLGLNLAGSSNELYWIFFLFQGLSGLGENDLKIIHCQFGSALPLFFQVELLGKLNNTCDHFVFLWYLQYKKNYLKKWYR